jgi:hypothetical protein
MSYKSFKGKWQAFGDKPIISILSTGLICFNKACYELYVKPSNCKYVKLYHDSDMRSIAFEFRPEKVGDFVLSISLTKTGYLAVVNGKTFFNYFKIKCPAEPRSYPVRETIIYESTPGYKRTRQGVKGIEIRLEEYLADERPKT